MQTLFEDLKVVELASVLAGPAVGMFFSEFGADVIKVENKRSDGDVTRQWRQPGETTEGPSAYYASVNWNKESVLLDFTDDADKKQVVNLLRNADIVITNFKKGDAEKFGLTYEDVTKLNPSIIYGAITGFGSDSDRVAYDLIMQAETGFMSMNGQPDSPPTKMPLAMIDLLAAHQLKEGVLCALLKQKDNPNQPFKVSVSLYESAISSLINQATNWLMNENIPQRIGSEHPNIAPYGEIFTTKDNQKITFAIGSDRQFTDLCQILNLEGLPDQPEFKNNAARVEHRTKLSKILQQEVGQREAADLLDELKEKLVPVGEIKNMEQVFASKKTQGLLLEEIIEGRKTIRPKTSAFHIRS